VTAAAHRQSLRQRLLLGILAPVLLLLIANSISLYRQALRAADTAYDRTLLASAKSIGEQLELLPGDNGQPRVRATVPYAALEAFEADSRSHLYYRVTGLAGELVSGFEDLPAWQGPLPQRSSYAALVHFYDARFQGVPVRMAVLLQPVTGDAGQGMATIQVAETLELRETLARQLLLDTLWRQAALIALIAAVVVWVVQRATRPVRELSTQLAARDEADLRPLDSTGAPRELAPLVEATNQVMARLDHLLTHQKRFVRDASHQLRTPLAVLKAQVQSAQRGDVDATTALGEISLTVDGATRLANQMLALAKVEQLRQQGGEVVMDWSVVVREVALELGPLLAEQDIDFDIETQPAPVRAHEWALRELTRNLLHNAIKHCPPGGALDVRIRADARHAALGISDSGPGLDSAQRARLFQPFAAGDVRSGSGLGLAICQEIAHSLGGQIELENRSHQGRTVGLDAIVRLPLAAALTHNRAL
jgi:two-component system, OmpR family, sensor histidine kinase TctE